MEEKLVALQKMWNWSNRIRATESEIESFESTNALVIPNDLSDYFKCINGTKGYDDGFFQFYSLDQFNSAEYFFAQWKTILNYETFGVDKSCFVFADYQIHLFSYVIQLYPKKTNKNEIYIFCGEEYKLIAESFDEFIDLCLEDSPKLFFND